MPFAQCSVGSIPDDGMLKTRSGGLTCTVVVGGEDEAVGVDALVLPQAVARGSRATRRRGRGGTSVHAARVRRSPKPV